MSEPRQREDVEDHDKALDSDVSAANDPSKPVDRTETRGKAKEPSIAPSVLRDPVVRPPADFEVGKEDLAKQNPDLEQRKQEEDKKPEPAVVQAGGDDDKTEIVGGVGDNANGVEDVNGSLSGKQGNDHAENEKESEGDGSDKQSVLTEKTVKLELESARDKTVNESVPETVENNEDMQDKENKGREEGEEVEEVFQLLERKLSVSELSQKFQSGKAYSSFGSSASSFNARRTAVESDGKTIPLSTPVSRRISQFNRRNSKDSTKTLDSDDVQSNSASSLSGGSSRKDFSFKSQGSSVKEQVEKLNNLFKVAKEEGLTSSDNEERMASMKSECSSRHSSKHMTNYWETLEEVNKTVVNRKEF